MMGSDPHVLQTDPNTGTYIRHCFCTNSMHPFDQYRIRPNLVTFFVKISEIAMAKLTCISFPLVESQSFRVDAGVT